MNPPNSAGYYYQKRTNQALAQGLVNMSTVDTALLRKWRTALRLGLFQQSTPWDHLGKETIHSPAHVALTLSAAEQSMTLLKHEKTADGTPMLPLKLDKLRRIALIGPGLDLHGGDMQGPYSGEADCISVQDALLARFNSSFSSKFVTSGGTPAGDGSNSTSQIPAAVSVAQQADVDCVVLLVNDQFVSEGADRTDTRLLYGQAMLIEKIAAVGKPIALVVIAGHTLDLSFAKAHPAVKAILWAYLPSEQGGPAIVNTLLGDSRPAGRLPFTIYPANITAPGQRPDPTDMALRSGCGVTHLHYTGTPVYEFGFGLTLTSWEFGWHRPPLQSYGSDEVSSGSLAMTVRVTNTGALDSEVVVPAFVRTESLHDDAFDDAARAVTPPVRELFDFQRVFCKAGSSVLVSVTLRQSVLALADNTGELAVRPGRYSVAVGGHPGGAEQAAASAHFEVSGAARTVLSLRELEARGQVQTE
eukprot:COSAG04_NODE_2257_length_4433_cov_2.916244_2_plen_473_part_00